MLLLQVENRLLSPPALQILFNAEVQLLELPKKEPQEYETSDFFRFYRINLQNQVANLPPCLNLLMQRSVFEKSKNEFKFFTENDKFHIQSQIDSINRMIVQQIVL